MKEKRIEIHTKAGLLIAELTGDPNYPGIVVSIKEPDSYERTLVIVEGPEKPVAYIYQDPSDDDYTHRHDFDNK